MIYIRALQPSDADPLRILRLEALQKRPTAFMADYAETLALPGTHFHDWIANAAPGAIFGAFDDAASPPSLVGMAGLAVNRGAKNRHKAMLWGVYVRPTHLARGIGQLLVEAVIEHARHCVTVLQASVAMNNMAARGLYHKLGFRSFGVEPKAACVDGVFITDDLLMLDFSDPV